MNVFVQIKIIIRNEIRWWLNLKLVSMIIQRKKDSIWVYVGMEFFFECLIEYFKLNVCEKFYIYK